MARYFDVHPRDPQPRSIAQVAALLRDDALIAYPTDSCYALGCRLDSPTGAARIDSPEELKEIATWASGIAPNKAIVEAHPDVVKMAHDAGLTVTLWTFRSSTTTFPSVRDEMSKFLYDLGADAVFTDNPDQFPRR